jgi:hypothetical protein
MVFLSDSSVFGGEDDLTVADVPDAVVADGHAVGVLPLHFTYR